MGSQPAPAAVRPGAPARDQTEAFYRSLVEGLSEGVVTRDARGTIVFASPRMCELLGCEPDEIVGTTGEQWVRPDRRDEWAGMLGAGEVEIPRTLELDLVRKDGRPLVALVSQRPVRDASGELQGSTALVVDISARNRETSLLRDLAQTISPLTGEDFFRSAVRYLAGAFGLQAVFVAECVDFPATRVRILAEWERGAYTEPREFALSGTPCNETIGEARINCLPDNLCETFPQYRARARMSYLGVPMLDPTDGRVIGHVAFWDGKPICREALVGSPLFAIFASRIGAELRRKRADDTLRVIAGTLAPTTGEAFFRGLLECLAKTLQVRVAFIAECLDEPPTRVRTLAWWEGDGFRDSRDLALEGLPCALTVCEGRETFFPQALGDAFPHERDRGLESYLGLPILAPGGRRVLGHLALLDDKPMPPTLAGHPLLQIFSSRIGAELRRKRADDTMWLIAEATAPLAGPEFFRTLVRYLAKALAFREVFITECIDADATRVRILSHWLSGGYAQDEEYDLAGKPCELTIRDRKTTFIGERLEALFPCCAGDQAYLGLPIFDGAGDRVIGHIAFFDDKPRQANVVENPVFRILASRAGVELLRKRAEDELRSSEAKYRLLVDNQTDLIIKLDRAGRYQFVSPSFCECFGRTERELLGQVFAPEVHALDREAFAHAYAEVLAPPHRSHVEARLLTADGWRWLAWSCVGVTGERGEVSEIIASGRDVTERKRAEEQARQHLQSLAHVTRLASMGEMASTIAHEVNQPLTAVLTYSEACIRLLRSGQARPGEAVEWMERVAAQAERASQIIRQVRTFVRKDEARLVPLQINYLVSEVVRLVQPDARHSSVEIVLGLADGLAPVLADNIQIQQVLVNLVRNAIEAISAAVSPVREVRITTRPGRDAMIEIAVEDSGPGFDATTAARLFEPFFTTKAEGMGIGLSISRSIVAAHGGRIHAEPRAGGGARFVLALPPAPQP